ncbi:hypothetical protein P4573_19220 [Priestia megaterium]|uniref:hypothetical protein n=1 Tax=Priestia megaterium TaxID=1404 RepID=UPI002E1E0BBE|nr:hypothetical protein [Priestia megaterium]
MVHSTGEVISRAKPMPIEVVGGASEINPISVPLQTGADSPDFGSSYTPTNDRNTLFFSITGTSTSRTISFEMKGPNGQYISTTAYSVIDPSVSSKSTTGGSTSNPEHWVVYIPAGYTFRTNVTAVVGGTVDVSGTAAV